MTEQERNCILTVALVAGALDGKTYDQALDDARTEIDRREANPEGEKWPTA